MVTDIVIRLYLVCKPMPLRSPHPCWGRRGKKMTSFRLCIFPLCPLITFPYLSVRCAVTGLCSWFSFSWCLRFVTSVRDCVRLHQPRHRMILACCASQRSLGFSPSSILGQSLSFSLADPFLILNAFSSLVPLRCSTKSLVLSFGSSSPFGYSLPLFPLAGCAFLRTVRCFLQRDPFSTCPRLF